jgi:hypothetical protein
MPLKKKVAPVAGMAADLWPEGPEARLRLALLHTKRTIAASSVGGPLEVQTDQVIYAGGAHPCLGSTQRWRCAT